MRSSLQTYATSIHAVVLFIEAMAYVGYEASYQYLNPANLQWQNAVIYGSMAIISALVLGHGVATAHAKIEKIAMGDTRSVPSIPSPRQS